MQRIFTLSLTDKQMEGIATLGAVITVLYAIRLLMSFVSFPDFVSVPFGVQESDSFPVALSVEGDERGIFFMPLGAKAADVLTASGYDFPGKFQGQTAEHKLKAGDKIIISGKPASLLTLEKMKAAELLALDLPLDINRATFDDLLLVPGIGEKTALQFIALRKRNGNINTLESLMEIRGIKGKKFAKLKKYLTIN